MAPTHETTASPRAARPRLIRRALALAAIAVAALASPAHALQLGPEAPHSPNTEDMATAYWVLIVVALVVIAAINGALIAALLRFRAERGRTAARITAGRGVMGRVAGAFGALAVAIFVFGVITADSARTVDAGDAGGLEATSGLLAQVPIADVPETGEADALASPLEIDAIAQQWLWRFEYPSDEREDIATLFSYGELVVPVDTTVVLNLTSTDVIHSWWVPALTGQVQAVPGGVSQTWFRADEAGVYEGRGTIFDGTLYPALTVNVRVVEPAEYESYLAGLADDLTEAQQAVQDEVASAAAAEDQAEEAP